MFDVGFAEIFLLALIGLMVLGPERLPGVARTIGGFVRKARASWVSLRNTIESELEEADLSAPIKKASEELKQIGKDLTDVSGINPENLHSNTDQTKSTSADKPNAKPAEDTDNGKGENV
jgi:sec-independent protein translocase protein TatB